MDVIINRGTGLPFSDGSLVGTDAGKPAAGAAGRLYFANDTGICYRDTGVAWVAVSVLQGAGLAPSAAGALVYDSTGKRYAAGGGGGTQVGYIPRVIANPLCTPASTDALDAGTGTGVQVFNTSVALATGLWIVGKTYEIFAGFDFTANGTVPTFLIGLRVQKAGPTNVTLWTDGAGAPSPATGTTRSFGYSWYVQVTAVSGAGTVECQAVQSKNQGTLGMGNTANPVAFDMTAAQTLQLTAQAGTATAGNIMRLRLLLVKELN